MTRGGGQRIRVFYKGGYGLWVLAVFSCVKKRLRFEDQEGNRRFVTVAGLSGCKVHSSREAPDNDPAARQSSFDLHLQNECGCVVGF